MDVLLRFMLRDSRKVASLYNLRGVDSVETNKYQSARRECRKEGAVEMIDILQSSTNEALTATSRAG